MSLFDLLTTAQAWASEAGHGGHHTPSFHEIWFPLGNFLIYTFIIAKFALPLVRSFLASRRDDVIATIEQASAKKQQAEALVSEFKIKLAGLDQEIKTMHGSLREEGERDKARLLAEAETLAAKIKEDARFLGEQEVKLARQQIRRELADQAEAAARALISRNLSGADQNRLVQEFIQRIG